MNWRETVHDPWILVVEDSAVHLLLKRIFNLAGLQIDCVDNWQDAASSVREGRFLYLLADFQTPVIPEREHRAEAGEIPDTLAVPVANPSPDVARQVRIDGVTIVLIRPFTIRTIIGLAQLDEEIPLH